MDAFRSSRIRASTDVLIILWRERMMQCTKLSFVDKKRCSVKMLWSSQ